MAYDFDKEHRDRLAWLAGLKVGDKVCLITSRGPGTIEWVTRVTPTQFVVGDVTRIWRKNGDKVGKEMWSFTTIYPLTEERLAAMAEHAVRRRFAGLPMRDLPVAAMREIIDVVAKYSAERGVGEEKAP